MNAIQTIQRVLKTSLLIPDLVWVAPAGANDEQILTEESHLQRPLTQRHRALIGQWNGLDLDVIRFPGCTYVAGPAGLLRDFQVASLPSGSIVCASDPAGFLYIEASDGRISSFDTDGGILKAIADDLDQLLSWFIFGSRAAEFAGEDWLNKLRAAGLVP